MFKSVIDTIKSAGHFYQAWKKDRHEFTEEDWKLFRVGVEFVGRRCLVGLIVVLLVPLIPLVFIAALINVLCECIEEWLRDFVDVNPRVRELDRQWVAAGRPGAKHKDCDSDDEDPAFDCPNSEECYESQT
jgi:hypothetical protein